MTLAAAPANRTDTDPIDAARVLGACRGRDVSVRLRDSGLLDLALTPVDGGVSPSTAAEVVRVVAVSHLDLARRIRRSVVARDPAPGHDLVARALDIALETGSAAAALHGVVAALRDRAATDAEGRSRVGELSVAVAAAEATLRTAAEAVDAVRTSDDDPALLRDEAVVALTTAGVLASRAAAGTARALVTLDAPDRAVPTDDLDVLGRWAVTGRVRA